MAEKRTPREQETRTEETRPSDTYVPPSVLPNPTPQDGWVFRYVRTSTLGNSDILNVSQKTREGWTPVRAEDHPEIQIISDLDSRWPDGIEVGGLLLCKAPAEIMEKRAKHFANMADNQIEAVDNNFFSENDPRMPLLTPDRKTRTQFGKG